jgi:hypothetical protein
MKHMLCHSRWCLLLAQVFMVAGEWQLILVMVDIGLLSDWYYTLMDTGRRPLAVL